MANFEVESGVVQIGAELDVFGFPEVNVELVGLHDLRMVRAGVLLPLGLPKAAAVVAEIHLDLLDVLFGVLGHLLLVALEPLGRDQLVNLHGRILLLEQLDRHEALLGQLNQIILYYPVHLGLTLILGMLVYVLLVFVAVPTGLTQRFQTHHVQLIRYVLKEKFVCQNVLNDTLPLTRSRSNV
eukprot:CAMPEP_0116960968 /NCGR_PEP_ID=MMETSP0467-20121206/46274_1 /TAXON_ID=283647 /ORGANISM="Mesodinium pulex, Strain SPMC105" /LENGTH=182 /DNA_ID=CAMNT_0004648793 /DNA_START=420 /DNA_END=968 /DNA_ORIENTATION=+